MFDCRVLGVDPGLSRCGLALVDGPSARARVVGSDVVSTPPRAPLGERLQEIHSALERLVAAGRPSSLAVERVFINQQARTGLGAVQVVGLVHLVAAEHALPVWEYTPSQVKAAVTGVGVADKEQVTFMVQRMLRLDAPPRPADKADALAVALCHLQQSGVHAATDAGGGAGADADLPPRLAAALARLGPGLQPVAPAAPATNGHHA